MRTASRTILFLGALGLGACWKQPIEDVNAGFAIADTVWFEDEQTMFVFWRVEAEQGLRPESRVEVRWTTDTGTQDWTDVGAFTPVHEHLSVDCGYTSRCGSTSIHVPLPPRNVEMRLRYHVDGEVFLDAPISHYEIASGPRHRSRSLIVYGVFDELNERIQWRARHQFPNLRNMEVEALGLRRWFQVREPGYGAEVSGSPGNFYLYGYAGACDGANTTLGWAPIETNERAIFDPNLMPVAASADPIVCGMSTVTDALGTFDAVAVARKNPEVRPAFPTLRSPIRTNSTVGFFLEPCNYDISDEHREMQENRLLLSGDPVICIDDWDVAGFANSLAAQIQQAVDAMRPEGNDMVVTLALHHDHPGSAFAGVIEDALDQVLVSESLVPSPHVSGAFVFDSYSHAIADSALRPLALWCPANLTGSLEDIPAESERSCPVLPDIPDLVLGPFKINALPILTTREQYLDFIDEYGEAQAGRMKSLRFLAPERSTISENVSAGEFGSITFFDDEIITADADDAFSFCALETVATIVAFRTDSVTVPLPIDVLPEFQNTSPEPVYELGLFFEFPFLVRLEYEVVAAGTVGAFEASVPFGISGTNRSYYGAELWRSGTFDLARTLIQCERFCDHPTFDSAGVYSVGSPFRETYETQCYEPRFPEPGDGGFPRDP